MLTPHEQQELRDLRRRDELLIRLIRDERHPEKRAALRTEHRRVVERIEALEAKEARP